MAIRVLIADDNPDDRMQLRERLSAHAEIEIVGEATGGRDVIDRAALLQPDVIVLDIRMPGISGLEAMPDLRRRCPGARIIALTGTPDASLEGSIRESADAYVLKSDTMTELVETVLKQESSSEDSPHS